MSTTELEATGPIDYLVVEFAADTTPSGTALEQLRMLVDRGLVNVLDLVFLRKATDGSVTRLAIGDVGFPADIDISLFAEAASGLLGDDDLAEAGQAMTPDRVGSIVVFENAWAAKFAVALREKGAQLVAAGRIPVQAIIATLDALDAQG